MKFNKLFLVLLLTFATHIFAQKCNYKTLYQNGIAVKQFNPMPIGGDNNRQVALSISNVAGSDNLMITIRFKENHSDLNKKVKFRFSNNKSVILTAERIGNDYVGGSPISHMIFSLADDIKINFIENAISSVTLNDENLIIAKMNQEYIKDNLNCLN